MFLLWKVVTENAIVIFYRSIFQWSYSETLHERPIFSIISRQVAFSCTVYTSQGSKTDGLFEGIQRNVFLYIDEDCMNSVLDGEPWVDDKWAWAVDPDYVPNSHDKDGYKGYLRVRLQQIAHRFFEARRFCADDYSMKYLWRASKKEFRNQVSVSIYDDEIGAWKGDGFL